MNLDQEKYNFVDDVSEQDVNDHQDNILDASNRQDGVLNYEDVINQQKNYTNEAHEIDHIAEEEAQENAKIDDVALQEEHQYNEMVAHQENHSSTESDEVDHSANNDAKDSFVDALSDLNNLIDKLHQEKAQIDQFMGLFNNVHDDEGSAVNRNKDDNTSNEEYDYNTDDINKEHDYNDDDVDDINEEYDYNNDDLEDNSSRNDFDKQNDYNTPHNIDNYQKYSENYHERGQLVNHNLNTNNENNRVVDYNMGNNFDDYKNTIDHKMDSGINDKMPDHEIVNHRLFNNDKINQLSNEVQDDSISVNRENNIINFNNQSHNASPNLNNNNQDNSASFDIINDQGYTINQHATYIQPQHIINANSQIENANNDNNLDKTLIKLDCVLGAISLSTDEIANIKPGGCIILDKLPATVQMVAYNKHICTGMLVELDGKLAVKIIDVAH